MGTAGRSWGQDVIADAAERLAGFGAGERLAGSETFEVEVEGAAVGHHQERSGGIARSSGMAAA